jgi:hypothetical protein
MGRGGSAIRIGPPFNRQDAKDAKVLAHGHHKDAVEVRAAPAIGDCVTATV